jgi:hypothetical protein
MRALSADEWRSSPDAYAAFVAETELSVEQAENRWRSQVGRVVYWVVVAELEAEGKAPLDASRMAVRMARACVLRLFGAEQAAIPARLGIAKRTADKDLERWRRLVDSGDIRRVGARPLPPIPRDERGPAQGSASRRKPKVPID